jgi:hypothetical protein
VATPPVAAAFHHKAQVIFPGEINRRGDVVGVSRGDRVDTRLGVPTKAEPSDVVAARPRLVQGRKHDPNFILRREVPPGCPPDIAYRLLCFVRLRIDFRSHLPFLRG